MILKTKGQIKEDTKELEDIKADPTLQKLWGIVSMINDFQNRISPANPVYEMTLNNVVPTSVKNFLQANPYQYVVTSVNATAPPGMIYTTTWVRITKISWAV